MLGSGRLLRNYLAQSLHLKKPNLVFGGQLAPQSDGSLIITTANTDECSLCVKYHAKGFSHEAFEFSQNHEQVTPPTATVEAGLLFS